MSYAYEYPHPAVAVDLVIRRDDQLLLIRRGNDPFAGQWALPGGFVEPGETVEQAAVRELSEETGVEVAESELRLVGVFSAPGRDPREWTISVVFGVDLAVDRDLTAGDDAAEAKWTQVDALPRPLAFDHDEIIARAQNALSGRGSGISADQTVTLFGFPLCLLATRVVLGEVLGHDFVVRLRSVARRRLIVGGHRSERLVGFIVVGTGRI